MQSRHFTQSSVWFQGKLWILGGFYAENLHVHPDSFSQNAAVQRAKPNLLVVKQLDQGQYQRTPSHQSHEVQFI